MSPIDIQNYSISKINALDEKLKELDLEQLESYRKSDLGRYTTDSDMQQFNFDAYNSITSARDKKVAEKIFE